MVLRQPVEECAETDGRAPRLVVVAVGRTDVDERCAAKFECPENRSGSRPCCRN